MSKGWIAFAMILVISAAPVQAGTISIGTNLGINHYIPEHGDGLTKFAWPSASDPFFYTFSPGLRLTFGLGESARQALYLDSGLSSYAISGESLTMVQFMLGYQMCFSAAATAPYLTGGAGMMVLGGGEGEAWSNPVLGGGLGVRHTLAHGKGAFRAELNLDRQFEVMRRGDVVSQALTVIGLKIGFDLHLK